MRLTLAQPCIALACVALALGLSGCLAGKPAEELSMEAVCLQHNENDPVERDRCRQSASNRGNTVPDVRPQDLPIRSGQPSD